MSTTKTPFMRAKMVATEVLRTVFHDGKAFVMSDRIKCSAVTKKPFDPDGISEDNTFAKFTPTGSLELTISNPALVGKIEPGMAFYLDFTPAD